MKTDWNAFGFLTHDPDSKKSSYMSATPINTDSPHKYSFITNLMVLAQIRPLGRKRYAHPSKDTWSDLLEELLSEGNFLIHRASGPKLCHCWGS